MSGDCPNTFTGTLGIPSTKVHMHACYCLCQCQQSKSISSPPRRNFPQERQAAFSGLGERAVEEIFSNLRSQTMRRLYELITMDASGVGRFDAVLGNPANRLAKFPKKRRRTLAEGSSRSLSGSDERLIRGAEPRARPRPSRYVSSCGTT